MRGNPKLLLYEHLSHHHTVKLLLAEDYEEIYRRLDVMLDVMEVLETSRKKAGILFPGDAEYNR